MICRQGETSINEMHINESSKNDLHWTGKHEYRFNDKPQCGM